MGSRPTTAGLCGARALYTIIYASVEALKKLNGCNQHHAENLMLRPVTRVKGVMAARSLSHLNETTLQFLITGSFVNFRHSCPLIPFLPP
jgi:hypothetical protein